MASSPNLSAPNHQFDDSKQYKKVVFQQGKPILDVDLNDMSDAILSQTTSALAEKMGFGPSQVDYRDWALLNVEHGTPLSTRNSDNFALSLGRIDTLKGVVDTAAWQGDGFDHKVVFDYQRLVENSAQTPTDRAYANYILKGAATSSSTGSSVTDDHKLFSQDMGLLARDYDRVVTSSATASQVNSAITKASSSFGVNVQEGACVVVFTSGEAFGESAVISSISNGGKTLNFSGVGVTAFSAGSEYVIVPSNTLQSYRNLYNAAQTQSDSSHIGLNNLPKMVTYLQAFEEDVSSDEDTSIMSSLLGQETTHRTQLRWCVRVALVYMSTDGDTLNSTAVTDLDLSHIFTELVGSKVDYQSMLDSASATDESQVTQYWRGVDSTGALDSALMGQMPSAFGVDGVTPLHFFASKEAQSDRLIWPFLKSIILRSLDGLNGFNDVQILNMHHSENKSAANAANETLTPYFYLGQVTDNTATNIAHARLGVKGNFTAVDSGCSPAVYSAPMRLLVSQSDLSEDSMLSRSLSGPSGVLYGATAPLVFPSVASHLSFIDQAVLGSLGLGGVGIDSDGLRVPSSIDYTPDGASASVAQSGYGAGAVKPIDLLASDSGISGFNSGENSYLLRDKGTRSSHTVHRDDEDLGWSLHIKEGSGLEGADGTDLSLRSWHQGIAQKSAFTDGLNFRKLAIKTTAHKSADLFTIAAPPAYDSNSAQLQTKLSAPSASLLIPSYKTDGSTIDLESYGGAAASYLVGTNEYLNSSLHQPSADGDQPKALLLQYYSGGATRDIITADSDRDVSSIGYGPWNRFDLKDASENLSYDPLNHPSDLWANRATAMRLRYHVGDFYPADKDARGVPRNALVDSINLFVRIEPLSLTHWMTMPKHQHSILENSLVLAEGIEALLKVSHGLGDDRWLIDSNGVPKIQETSPYATEGSFPHKASLNELGAENYPDPYDLPFGHEHQPFIHWYHPSQNNLQMPHPSGGISSYTATGGGTFTVTPYPKWGRRSMIVPAMVPFKMVSHTLVTPSDEHDSHEVPVLAFTNNGSTVNTYPSSITSDDDPTGINAVNASGGLEVDAGVIPYVPHASKASSAGSTLYQYDNGSSEYLNDNQITFPALFDTGSDDEHIGPVFLPASRKYLRQAGDLTRVELGFNALLSTNANDLWNHISDADQESFPYDERQTHYLVEANNISSDLPDGLNAEFEAWSVPVMRGAIRTRTVAAIAKLIRTSFDTTQINSTIFASGYDFTMPNETWDPVAREGNQTPAIGPDLPSDTLFVGDSGTAVGGYSERLAFMSPLNLGVGALHVDGGLLHNSWTGQSVVRDAFEAAWYYASNENATQPILNTFWALRNQGLQQKLLFNCSFRVLHHRPAGKNANDGHSTMPKSLTEMFLVHDRTQDNAVRPLSRGTNKADSKPFIHLASTHPASAGVNNQTAHPNYSKMSHLYPMVSDSIGGSADPSTYIDNNGRIEYISSNNIVQTTAMGDTFTVDPFDYLSISNGAPSVNIRSHENAHNNSGIEIELLTELNAIHADPTTRGLDITGGDFELIDTIPTANELTQAGDHEIVFVLYTGHYGAKLFDSADIVDVTNTPSVAGCHLTATLEINRPSERISSTATDEHHYGATDANGDPINVYSIPSTT